MVDRQPVCPLARFLSGCQVGSFLIRCSLIQYAAPLIVGTEPLETLPIGFVLQSVDPSFGRRLRRALAD